MHSARIGQHGNFIKADILFRARKVRIVLCGCIWTPPYCNGLFGLVQDHDCWRISGFCERPDISSPRAPMDFRLLPPHWLQGISGAAPIHTPGSRSNGSCRCHHPMPSCCNIPESFSFGVLRSLKRTEPVRIRSDLTGLPKRSWHFC